MHSRIESDTRAGRLRSLFGVLLLGGLAMCSGVTVVWATEEAPQLPAYFTATNDAEKPAWPDPTGGASGVWATPAGDAKGDLPSSLSLTDLYDRVAHNLYSINYVWALVAGFLVMFMQA